LANTNNSGRLHRQPQVFTADRWLNALRLIGASRTDVANADNNGLSAATFGGSIKTPTDKQSARQDNPTDTQGRSGISGEMADTAQQYSNGQSDYSRDSERPETIPESGDGSRTSRRSNWQIEPDVGRVADGVPFRVDRLRGLGNAVVPQVAELIGRMVIDYDAN
jgi:hypothetical protein